MIKCSECGKEISSQTRICPHCGNPIRKKIEKNYNKLDNFCLSGFVISLISFLIDFFGLVSATGLALSIIGLNRTSQAKSKKFAIAGIVCSSIELVLKVIQLINLMNGSY